MKHAAPPRFASVLLGAGLALVAATQVHAGGCSVSASPLAFSSYQAVSMTGKLLSTDRRSDATVVVNCIGITTGGSYSMTLGPDDRGSIGARSMATPASTARMQFNIFTDAAFSRVWGDGVSSDALAGSLPTGDSRQEHRVYGLVPGGQSSLAAGAYSTSLPITLRYDP